MKSIGILLFTALLLISCQKSTPTVSEIEINRIISPDSLVDAVVIEQNGALTDTFYRVYIVPTTGKPKVGHEIFLADGIRNLNMIWLQPKLLEISYDKARIFQFSNFWSSSEVEDFSYVIEIKLAPNDSLWSLTERSRWVDYIKE
jgi:hypothetical protein